MYLRCFGEVIPMRSTVRYSDDDLYDACCRIRAKYQALTQKEMSQWNVSIEYSVGSSLPVPSKHLSFACALVARYHNDCTAPR